MPTKRQRQNRWELEQMHGDIKDPNPAPGGPPESPTITPAKEQAVPMPQYIKDQLNEIIIRKGLSHPLFGSRDDSAQDQ